MLDLQRQQYAPYQSSGAILFTRKFLVVHMACGVLAVALLIFHEFFAAAGWVLLWHLASLLVAGAMTKGHAWSRLVLAQFFLAAAGGGFFAMVWILPALKPVREPMLPPYLLPFWLAVASLGYAAGAYVLLFSQRIRRASGKGFSLLDAPKDR